MSLHVSDILPAAAPLGPTATPCHPAMVNQVAEVQLYTDAAQAFVLLKGIAHRLGNQPQREGQACMASKAAAAVDDLIRSLTA